MTKKKNTINMLPQIRSFGFAIVIFHLLLISCEKKNDSFEIKIDLASEMGAGMFTPAEGDSIFIAGNFNDWSTSKNPLKQTGKKWVYGAALSKLIDVKDEKISISDTMEFKFYIKSLNPSKLMNAGWETVENRKHVIGDIIIDKPVFLYNEISPVENQRDVTFTVGMANQKVLGFFEPDSGDIVVVTGAFLNWSPLGIPLEKEFGNLVYSTTVPVSGDNIEYKFRILSKREKISPEQGWEKRSNRVLNTAENTETRLKYFDDFRRVLRFDLNTKAITRNGFFNPETGDHLQVKLSIDERESLSDYLYQVGEHEFETAIIIPANAADIKWKMVKNIYQDMSDYKSIKVPVEGKLIKVKL